jgi:hypothetical protein
VAEVGLDHIGVVLGIEIWSLPPSSRDWYQLLDVCALFSTLIVVPVWLPYGQHAPGGGSEAEPAEVRK